MAHRLLCFICLVLSASLFAGPLGSHQNREDVDENGVFTRCAIDVGSGTTRIKVAKVNAAEEKVVEILFQDERKVPYQASINSQGLLPSDILKKGAIAIHLLLERAQEKVTGPRELASSAALKCRAIAGAPFEDIQNARQAINYLSEHSGVQITVISQEEQAKMGLLAALAVAPARFQKPISPLDMAVWDIGGATMDLTLLRPGVPTGSNDRFIIHTSHLGSELLKQYIIEHIQKKPAGTKSPNPITQSDLTSAMQYIRSQVAEITPDIRSRLQAPGVQVLGIGPVHSKSLLGQTNTFEATPLTQERLRATLQERIGWTDQKIGGAYADTQISNLILVLGFMEQLHIPEVTTLSIDLNDGLLVSPRFWAKG